MDNETPRRSIRIDDETWAKLDTLVADDKFTRDTGGLVRGKGTAIRFLVNKALTEYLYESVPKDT